jgi:hypothetical protein
MDDQVGDRPVAEQTTAGTAVIFVGLMLAVVGTLWVAWWAPRTGATPLSAAAAWGLPGSSFRAYKLRHTPERPG